MELEDKGMLRSSYEVALSRFSRSSQEHDAPPAKKDSWSVYDQSLFVEDDRAKHVEDPSAMAVPSPPEIDPDLDQVTPLNTVEPLTFPKLPEINLADFPVKIHYRGPLFDYGGYARMNRTYIFGLKDLGVLVKTDPYDSITNVNKRTEDALRQMTSTSVPSTYPKIFGMTIPSLLAHGGRKILYTMMETSNKVHQEYADRLNLADEVWTPTTWCKETFENSGVAVPIHVMPLGVETQRYKPGLEPINFGDNVRSFRFLSASGWSYRKGFDILIRAFLEEFSNKDDVTLILSTRYAGGLSQKSKDRLLDDFMHFRRMCSKPDGDLPHIVLHSTYIPEAQMPNLYNSAHCFVLISRGEGWGLPYCEAASCGIPVIASDHGGQRDFLDEETAYLVPPSSYFVSKREDQAYKNMAWISHFYENQEFPDYEGDAYELVKHHLRYVYENYQKAQEKAQKLRQRILSKYDWKHSIIRVYNRLKELCSDIRD